MAFATNDSHFSVFFAATGIKSKLSNIRLVAEQGRQKKKKLQRVETRFPCESITINCNKFLPNYCTVCGVSKKELLQHLKNALNAKHSPEFLPIFLLLLFFVHLTKIAFGDFYWIFAWT